MNRIELINTLELLKPALSKDPRIPIFQCFCFDKGRVSAYDDEIAISGPVDCSDTFAIHGVTFVNLLSNSTAEDLTITVKKDNAEIKAGKAVMTLPSLPKDNFLFKEPTFTGQTVAFTESLFQALKQCLETVSRDETQRALMGVTIQNNQMYSCNGDVLTRVALKADFKQRVMMPTAFAEAVVKIWTAKTMTTGTLVIGTEWLGAQLEDWDVYSRVPEINQTLDFEAEIKKGFKTPIEQVEVPDGLDGALRRARVLSDAESTKTHVVISKGKICLHTTTHMGVVEDALPLKHHPDLKCAIHAGHISDALKHCDSLAFYENCVVLERKPDVFILVSNL